MTLFKFKMKSVRLSFIEPAIDITGGSAGVQGSLILSRIEEKFLLSWQKLDNSSTQHITATSQDKSEGNESVEWIPGINFQINCTNVESLSLREIPKHIILVFVLKDNLEERLFKFGTDMFVSIGEFIEQLLINGIAVPQTNEKDPYSLVFYSNCHKDVYAFVPPSIQLNIENYSNLDAFWTNVHNFTTELIVNLDDCNTLPNDPIFPISAASISNHNRLLEVINAYVSGLPEYEQITEEELPSFFDEEGRIKDPDMFQKRIFFKGASDSIQRKILPFVLGVYALNSTQKERDELDEHNIAEFERLRRQLKTVTQDQLKQHKKLAGSFRVISHDVSRTDRIHPAFKFETTPGLTMLTELLQCYCLFNPPIGYLQGMNDLFVPIILAYMPNWNDEGMPIDADGNIIDHTPYIPKIFWCFESMVRHTNHLSFLSGVTEQCQTKAKVIQKLLGEMTPLSAIWMRRKGLSELLWLYSDFLLLFKRTFDKIWPIWYQFNCCDDRNNWMTYFVTALLIRTFPDFANLPDVSISSIMDAFPKLLKCIDPTEVGKVALWLQEFHKLPEVPPPPPYNPDDEHFDFFEAEWLSK